MNRFERRHPDASNEWPVEIVANSQSVSPRPLDLPLQIMGTAQVRNVEAIARIE